MKRIKKNVYKRLQVYNDLVSLKNLFYNIKYMNFLKQISEIDSIDNYSSFKYNIQKAINSQVPVTYRKYGADAFYYGYYFSMLNYADEKPGKYPLLSSIEHGVYFGSEKTEYADNALTYCNQNTLSMEYIHNINPLKMYFTVGPYIHYASKYYSDEKELELKKKLGRVLLVFPSHTSEWTSDLECKKEKNFLDIIYTKYKKYFDTILVCTYWYNVNDSILSGFEERGSKIVAAGFRGDRHFIRRLKTIISVADAVVGDDIGTNIGFSIYMNKPFFLECEAPRFRDAVFEKNFNDFKEAFYSSTLSFSDAQKKLQMHLYEKFWGNSKIKSPKEMRYIFEIIKLILHKSKQNSEKFNQSTEKYIQLLDLCSDEVSKEKSKILLEAIRK